MTLTTRRRRRTVEPLRHLELFRDCTPDELERLRSLMTPVILPAGRSLTRLGDIGREFFVIVDGAASVLRDDERVASLGPGAFVGEMALLDGGRRTATVVADTNVEVFVLSEREFDELLRRSPTVAHNMLRILSQRLRAA